MSRLKSNRPKRKYLAAGVIPLALSLLVGPAAAWAIEINRDFKPENEFKLDPWIELQVGPIDMSITKGVLYVVLAGLLTVLAMVWVARRMQMRPNKVQVVVELLYGMLRDNVTKANIDNPKIAKRWFAFLGTLFFFIWFSNLLGYLPLPTNTEHKVDVFGVEVPALALYAATANLSVPLLLTLIVWFSYHVEGIREKGPIGYFKGWIPAGIKGPILLFVAPIEVLSQFVRLVSLSARLFANIFAGHLLILIMGGGLVVLLGTPFVGALTLPVAIGFFLFEVGLVATLQAFIFTMLSAIYLGGATADNH